jgi:excisionase family DNA binding protein
MTVPEMTTYMRISKKTAYKLISDGKIPFCRISPRKILVNKSEIDEYVNKFRSV